MGYSGDGGPPPPPGQGGGFKRNDPQYGFSEQVTKDGKTFMKRVKTWYLPPGANDKPCVMLDRKGNRYTLTIHEFVGPDGRKGSMVRCIARANPKEGCPLCDALGKEGRWYWALTCIDKSRFIPKEGRNVGNVYTNFRRLVLVTSKGFDDMKAIEGKSEGGWHGRRFDVSRSDDSKSAKIGTNWFPNTDQPSLTDDEMKAEFAEAADNYGIPIEKFIEPFNYDTVLALPSYDEAKQIAAAIKGTVDGGGEDSPEGDSGAISF